MLVRMFGCFWILREVVSGDGGCVVVGYYVVYLIFITTINLIFIFIHFFQIIIIDFLLIRIFLRIYSFRIKMLLKMRGFSLIKGIIARRWWVAEFYTLGEFVDIDILVVLDGRWLGEVLLAITMFYVAIITICIITIMTKLRHPLPLPKQILTLHLFFFNRMIMFLKRPRLFLFNFIILLNLFHRRFCSLYFQVVFIIRRWWFIPSVPWRWH